MIRAIGIVVLVIVVGVFLWGAGLFAIGRSGENVCLNDMNADRGSYTTSGSFFPPQHDCRYRLVDGSREVVSHPIRAWTTFVTVALFLPVYFIGVLIHWRNSTRLTTRT